MVFSRKNYFLLILILGVALVILSGCGGSSNNTINDVNETNDQAVANNKLDTFLNAWKNEDVLSMGNALSYLLYNKIIGNCKVVFPEVAN